MLLFEKWLILVPLYSVFSVHSVVLADKITTEYTENTQKTLNEKSKTRQLRGDPFALHSRKFKLNRYPTDSLDLLLHLPCSNT